MRSVDGLSSDPTTTARVAGSAGGKSSAAASSARQGVSRVQARSVSPAVWFRFKARSLLHGAGHSFVSVMRRWAILPSAVPAGLSGASWGHHTTTGRSEEHTSELQSRGHLVCRLLLE